MSNIINWDDPAERAALAERLGPDAYNAAFEKHCAETTVAIVGGHAIRPVGSRFGRIFMVGGTTSGFSTLEQAKAFALETANQEASRAFQEAGFEHWHTGGGCTAWRKELPDGRYLMITDSSGCDATLGECHESHRDKPDAWMVGIHNDSDCLDCREAADAKAALAACAGLEPIGAGTSPIGAGYRP